MHFHVNLLCNLATEEMDDCMFDHTAIGGRC
jgi:hypothetical protein